MDQLARRRSARIELAATIGGTVGLVTVVLLRAAGKPKHAEALAFLGILAGGILGLIRVADRYPDV